MQEIVAAYPVFGYEVADDRLDGGTLAHLALDLRGPPCFWPEMNTLNVFGCRIVAATTFVENEALDDVADERLQVWDHDFKRVAVIGVAGQRLHMGDELTALSVPQCAGDGDLPNS